MNVHIVELDPDTWYRGKGSQKSRLLTSDGMMCCVGFACKAMGLRDADIVMQPFVGDGTPIPDGLEFMWSREYDYKTDVAERVYAINDYVGLSGDEERVRLINQITEPHGLKFVLKGQG